jgi:hypothetical protein
MLLLVVVNVCVPFPSLPPLSQPLTGPSGLSAVLTKPESILGLARKAIPFLHARPGGGGEIMVAEPTPGAPGIKRAVRSGRKGAVKE